MSDSPEPKPVFLTPSAAALSGASADMTVPVLMVAAAAATSGASVAVTTPISLRAAAAGTSSASATVSAVPLVQVASAAVYPSAGGSQVVVTPRPDSPLPGVDVSLAENAWDLATLSSGFGIGYAVGKLPGGIVGGVGCYAWGRVRWRQVKK